MDLSFGILYVITAVLIWSLFRNCLKVSKYCQKQKTIRKYMENQKSKIGDDILDHIKKEKMEDFWFFEELNKLKEED